MKENLLEKLQKSFYGDEDLRVRQVQCGISLNVVCLDTMCDDKK